MTETDTPVPTTSFLSFEVNVLVTSGPMLAPGAPELWCRLGALDFGGPAPKTRYGRGLASVLHRDGRTWGLCERPVTTADAAALLGMLTALGVPGRQPEVEGVVDTADCWEHLHFDVRVSDRRGTFEVPMQASGFEGPDAPAVRACLARLFTLAGFEAGQVLVARWVP